MEQSNLENVIEYTEKLRTALPESIQYCIFTWADETRDKNRIMEEYAHTI